MTSVDADLRSGRRLETGRRCESIIYILLKEIQISDIDYQSLFHKGI